jgi:hypothetical protein
MKAILIFLVSASLLAAACSPGRIAYSAVPLPPGAESASPEGPEEVPIDLTQGDIWQAVRDKYGKPRIEIYLLPADADWGKVTQFYAERLKGGDWQSEPRFSKRTGYYEMTGWSRGGGQALIVAYLDKPGGVSRKYLLVALAPEGDG